MPKYSHRPMVCLLGYGTSARRASGALMPSALTAGDSLGDSARSPSGRGPDGEVIGVTTGGGGGTDGGATGDGRVM